MDAAEKDDIIETIDGLITRLRKVNDELGVDELDPEMERNLERQRDKLEKALNGERLYLKYKKLEVNAPEYSDPSIKSFMVDWRP